MLLEGLFHLDTLSRWMKTMYRVYLLYCRCCLGKACLCIKPEKPGAQVQREKLFLATLTNVEKSVCHVDLAA
jgi:hypothetical protein